MPNLTSVGITAGVPTTGTGTVSTIDNLIGTAGTGSAQVLTVQGNASGTALPVSGTVTINAIPTGTNTIGSVKTTDGTNTAAVKAASTAPVSTDPALVVAIHPLSINGNGQAVMSSSAPVAIASNQATLAVAMDTSQVANGVTGTNLTPTKVKISVAAATTTTLVALVAAKKIRILSLYLVSTAANTVTLQSHTTTTNSDGGCAYAANGGIALPFNPIGWFDTTAGEALDMVTSGAGQVSGQLSYIAV